MLRFVLPLLWTLASTNAISYGSQSAASEAQIKFAIENKYDDTGPGAKQPEHAHKTYQNLEEALIEYVNDPDTKLPEAEKNKAFKRLYKPNKQTFMDVQQKLERFLPKSVEEYTAKKPEFPSPIYITRYSFPDKKVFYHEPRSKLGILDLRSLEGLKSSQLEKFRSNQEQFKLSKLKPIRTKPVTLSHFTRESESFEKVADPQREYTYSYGVNDRHTGDQKAAHETREGGNVRGYYTVMDADGKQRTVHYTANDKEGFKAVVQRTNVNNH